MVNGQADARRILDQSSDATMLPTRDVHELQKPCPRELGQTLICCERQRALTSTNEHVSDTRWNSTFSSREYLALGAPEEEAEPPFAFYIAPSITTLLLTRSLHF